MAEATYQSDADLRAIKKRVSAPLLKEPGVTGVGISEGRLMVYLDYESAPLQKRVLDIIHSLVGNATSVAFLATGMFHAR